PHRGPPGPHRGPPRRAAPPAPARPPPRPAHGRPPPRDRPHRTRLSRPDGAATMSAPRRAPRLTVLGAGSWGTPFAQVLADGGAEVTLWARREEVAREIGTQHRNNAYLGHPELP